MGIFTYAIFNAGLYVGVTLGSPLVLGFIGLTPIGPVAGGLFAAYQGSALVSGSLMATAQTIAMLSPV